MVSFRSRKRRHAPMLAAAAALPSFLALLAPPIVVAEENCTLTCNGHGTCAAGPAGWIEKHLPVDIDSSPHWIEEMSTSSMHCECDSGWIGLQCDREYIGCDDKEKGHKCFHGGVCVPGNIDFYKNTQFYCDCTEAEGKDGTKYAGKYCEHASAEKCPDGDAFCTNGGKCKKDAAQKKNPCKCNDGDYEGPHCEYLIGTKPDCSDFDCNGHGYCDIGLKSYQAAILQYDMMPFQLQKHDDFRHCVCDEGYTGLYCDVEVTECGDIKCYNGSKCIKKQGNNGHHCDCSTASTETKSYAGMFCEHESTGFCTKEKDHNGNTFCVNGGQCGEKSHNNCICKEGYTGPLCEFPTGKVEAPACDLQCFNGGKCRFGSKPSDAFPNNEGDNFDIDVLSTSHVNQMHCVCEQGYAGVQCNTKVEECGEGEHICLNDSKCVKDGDKHACDCGPARNAFHQYAGLHCEFPSTTFCIKGGNGLGFQAGNAFCVNGGKCKGDVSSSTEGHKGCECLDGFEGNHCEYKQGMMPNTSSNQSSSTDENDGPNAAFIIAVLLTCLAIFIGLVVVVVRSKNAKWVNREKEVPIELAGSNEFTPSGVGFDPEKDDEGHEMHNVEIL